jgi:uncharacterized protein
MLDNLCRCLLFVLLLVPAAARSDCPPPLRVPTAEVVQNAMAKARDHGFLWRISKSGRTSYLYGTIHVGKLEWSFPGPLVQQALRNVDTVALELDPLDPEIQRRMLAAAAALRGTALPKSVAQRVQKQLSAYCVTTDAFGSAIPELQMVMLSLAAARQAGLESAYAVDIGLAAWGHRANKEMVSLETPEGQLQALQMRNAQETIDFVETGLDDLESGRSAAKSEVLAKVWAAGDSAAMDRFDEWCDCLGTEVERKLMQRLLDGRNPGLAESIDALHRSGKQVFAAVGSLHLFGRLGLPTLMAQRGFRVERIDFNKAAAGGG